LVQPRFWAETSRSSVQPRFWTEAPRSLAQPRFWAAAPQCLVSLPGPGCESESENSLSTTEVQELPRPTLGACRTVPLLDQIQIELMNQRTPLGLRLSIPDELPRFALEACQTVPFLDQIKLNQRLRWIVQPRFWAEAPRSSLQPRFWAEAPPWSSPDSGLKP
jgi:hypothetical protein